MTWQVCVGHSPDSFPVFEGVTAECFLILNGSLLFYSDPECAPRQLVIGYAPGEWKSFFREDG